MFAHEIIRIMNRCHWPVVHGFLKKVINKKAIVVANGSFTKK